MKLRHLIFFALLTLAIALPALAASAAATPIPDPDSDPGAFFTELAMFWRTCWPVAAALGAYGLLEVAATLGKDVAVLAWLGTGRVSIAISGSVAVLGAGLNAYLGGGTPQAALWAAVVSLASFWHPAAEEVSNLRAQKRARKAPTAPTTPTSEAGFVAHRLLLVLMAGSITALLGGAVAAEFGGCGTVRPIITDVIRCADAEAATVSSGYSLIQIVAEVAGALKKGPTGIESAVLDLVKKYGGDVVACIIDSTPEPEPTAGSGAPLPSAPADVLAKRVALAKVFPGKKIDHTARKN